VSARSFLELATQPGAPPDGAFARILLDGAPAYCVFDGGEPRFFDRPPFLAGGREKRGSPRAAVCLLAPVEPSKIVAVGLNYRAHAAEFGDDVPAEPLLFLKPPSAVMEPGGTIVLPAQSRRVDYEAELAVVIGSRCRSVSAAEAAAFVAGYTCGNDVTARDLQKTDGQWTRAKSFDTFCPLGPWVVPNAPGDEARVSARIDGRAVQTGRIGDMIASPLELVAYASTVMTLEPGDVLMTGTPPGVGPLAAGQTVTVEVEGVGRLTNPVA